MKRLFPILAKASSFVARKLAGSGIDEAKVAPPAGSR